MKIVLAQVKFKTADLKYNFEKIIDTVNSSNCDLIIFPSVENLGEKDLCFDDDYQKSMDDFYCNLLQKNFDKAILLGDVLIADGEITVSDNKFYNICDKVVYIDDVYRDDIICDLYVLNHKRYFVKDGWFDFVGNIETHSDFVFVNPLCMADCNIYCGGSFAKNSNNELVCYFDECKEVVKEVDFNNQIDLPVKSEEKLIYDVIIFALREYCENVGFKKVLLGLSGGIDSALVAVLACDALGADNVLGVMMPSMYSSDGSIKDSVKLADNLKMQVQTVSITPLFEKFMENNLKTGDLAEENLQARIRALILMFISNRENRLLLTTSNKSESAMGFGTLYGDMAGGLNVLCDLTKTNVYKLSNYINRNGEIIPQEIIKKAPSAELHPNQKDEDRLPKYEILDDIIEMYFDENVSNEEIFNKYGKEFAKSIIQKIYRFQFKRKQTCLGVRLCERSFCEGINLPIVQRFY